MRPSVLEKLITIMSPCHLGCEIGVHGMVGHVAGECLLGIEEAQ
jgi:hypothetical protein